MRAPRHRQRIGRSLVLLAALCLCACETTHYTWGGYDSVLYAHYKAPQDHAAYVERLKAVVLAAQQQGALMPPGLCAEYGYALLEQGKPDEAVLYFKQESAQWPESRLFMEKMIRNASRKPGDAKGGSL